VLETVIAQSVRNGQNRSFDGDPIRMKTMTARDAKNAFGMLIDWARAEPVTIEKHGRQVVVVMAVEEYERLKLGQTTAAAIGRPSLVKPGRRSRK
jgi:prevent-host-death family protein